MKEEFINFVNALIDACPDVVENLMTDNIRTYLEALAAGGSTSTSELTENGAKVLAHMQKSEEKTFKAKDIAEELFISSRSVSGSLRKLVNDGYAEKIGQDPVIYTLTEKGKTYNI